MIVDFHTHTFPEKIAKSAIKKLSVSGDTKNYTDGTADCLLFSMKESNIDYSVILPVATNPSQCTTINSVAANVNDTYSSLISFGGIHPDSNYKEVLNNIHSAGIKGIKLHPVCQNVDFDDIRIKRIIEYAESLNLITVAHAGYDISFPEMDNAIPEKIINVIHDIHPKKLVLAHMGGWGCYYNVLDILASENVYFDTSFSITPIINAENTAFSPHNCKQLTSEMFVSLIRKHGAEKILFGSDSPWSSQKESLDLLMSCGLSDEELSLIKSTNACRLLGISV